MNLVWVCTWDPKHTLARVRRQEAALQNGVIDEAVKELGHGPELVRWFAEQRFTSVRRDEAGTPRCAECNAPAEEVHAPPGATTKLKAVESVAENLGEALRRTRLIRAGIDPDAE